MSSQPIDQVYQNPVMTSQPNPSHSNGSFRPVFIVLAVIIVISAVACVLGRLGSKRYHSSKEGSHKPSKAGKQSQGLGPKEWESRQKPSYNMRDGDNEFGAGKQSQGPKEWESRQKPSYNMRDGDIEFGAGKQSQGLGPNEWESRQKPSNNNMRDGDIEYGFDKKMNSKGDKNGGGNYSKPMHYNNGAHRPDQVRFADNLY